MTGCNVNDMCPELLELYREWVTQCHAAGLAIKATVTWRSPAEQDIAKSKGLSKASAGQSPHNCVDANGKPFSKAFDFACFDSNGHYITDGTDKRYTQAGEIGETLGLVWGGNWSGWKDFDHLQLLNWKTEQAEPVSI